MSMRAKPAVIGFFILGAAVVLAVGVILMGGGRLWQKTTAAVIFFDRSVAGLEVGAPVTFRGVKVGIVKRVALQFSPATADARIPVYIELGGADLMVVNDASVEPGHIDVPLLVEQGLRAQLQTQSFVTGKLMVELDFKPGSSGQTVGTEPSMAEIPAARSDLDKLKDTVSDLPVGETLTATREAMLSIRRMAEAAEQQIALVGTKSVATAEAADQLLATSREAMEVLQGDVSATLTELRALSESARMQIDGRGGQFATLLNHINNAAEKIDRISAGVDEIVAPRSPMRRDMEAALRDMAGAAAALRGFADQIERNPNAVLLGSEKR